MRIALISAAMWLFVGGISDAQDVVGPSSAALVQFAEQHNNDADAHKVSLRMASAAAKKDKSAPEATSQDSKTPKAADPSLTQSSTTLDSGRSATDTTSQPEIEEIVVTGSLIARRDYQAGSPIMTIGQDAIMSTGQVAVDRALGEMPQFAAAQGMTEVGDVQGGTGFSGGQAYGDLRGLGPNRTLVLLDGRRMLVSNPDGSVDLNTVPYGLLQSAEVVTGGASAAYGSDAIAGVVNFKLRQVHGIELNYQHGATTFGDGKNDLISATIGGDFAESRGKAEVYLEYSERSAVHGSARPFFNNVRAYAYPLDGIIESSATNAPTISAVNHVLGSYPNTSPLPGVGAYPGAIGVNTDGTIFTDNFPLSPIQNYRGPGAPLEHIGNNTIATVLSQYFDLQVPLTKYNLFSRAEYKINDSVSAFGQINYMRYSAQDMASPADQGGSYDSVIPIDNPFISSDLRTILNSRPNPNAPIPYATFLTELGNRIEAYDYNVFQETFGLSGQIPGHDVTWQVFGSYGQDILDNVQYNSGSYDAYQQILNGTANYTSQSGQTCIGYGNFNPFGIQTMSPGCVEFVRHNNHNTDTITSTDVEASAQGKIAALTAGDLRFAVGTDHRSERFNYVPDSFLVNGHGFVYGKILPSSGAQSVNEIFGELLVPLLSDRPFAKELSADLGYRYSRYTQIGGANTFSADLSWRPTTIVRVRGGYQRAIRAPSLGELYSPDTTQFLPSGTPSTPTEHLQSGDPCDVNSAYRNGPNAAKVAALCEAQGVPAALMPTFTYGSSSMPALSGGNQSLQPETADSYSMGTVITPKFDSELLRNFDVSVDYWNIKIKNAIGSIGLTDILQRCFNADGTSNRTYANSNIYCSLLTRDPNTGDMAVARQLLLNLATYQTDGVDMQFDWGFGLGALGLSDNAGRLRLNSVITYTRTFDVSTLPGAPKLNYAGSIGNTDVSPDIAHPHWKAVTSVAYSVGGMTAGVKWRFIGPMVHQDSILNPTSTTPGVPAYSYFDLNLDYNLTEHFEVSGGVTNLANKEPPIVSGTPLNTDPATYDIIGRAFYLNVKGKF